MSTVEVNFDGLVGPTHNYAGLSVGNVASLKSAKNISNPRQAARQGLKKMKSLHDMGMIQGVLAPQERPDINTLRRLGFTGSDGRVLEDASKKIPELFNACCSASSMWTANAATISPSSDTGDHRVHFTPANLSNKFHRSIEPVVTGNVLKAMFSNTNYFVHHEHLPEHDFFGDEGAANHTRFCGNYDDQGVEFFVYGRQALSADARAPQRFPARQTLEASQAIARLHQLNGDRTVFAQQNPEVIDQGVFHNDVIAVGNQNVLFHHQEAFLNTASVYAELQKKMGETPMHFIEVKTADISVSQVVNTYLFNTQLITLPSGEMAVIAPTESQENASVFEYLSSLTTLGTPIKQINYFDVKQSMKNGGGPACLRLRVVLNTAEREAMNSHVLMSNALFITLNQWIDKHYRDVLSSDDLRDPLLLSESRTALDELTQILNLGAVYPFQKE